MSKFKAGDLAMIINAKCEANIGRVVQLVRCFSSDRARIRGQLFVTRHGSPAWEVEGDLASVLAPSIGFGFLSESCLMPLRGDFQPEQQKAKEVEI